MKQDHAKKQVDRMAPIDRLDQRELTLADLDMVAGGKGATGGTIFHACVHGEHIKKAILTC